MSLCYIDRNRRSLGIRGPSLWLAATVGMAALAGCGGSGGSSSGARVTLATYTSDVALTSADTTVYSDTFSDTFSPDPYNLSVLNQVRTVTDTGNGAESAGLAPVAGLAPITGESLGTPGPATIALPISGNISVTRQAILDSLGNVEGFEYYNLSDAGETYYGDDLLVKGVVGSSTRYDPGVLYPYSLTAGQTKAQTYVDYETTYNTANNSVSKSFSYPVTTSTQFVSILPSVTVPAGTYTNVANVQYFSSGNVPAGADGNVNVEARTVTATFDLSRYVGVVQSQTASTTANELVTPSNTSDAPFSATEIVTHNDTLTSATVGGTSYPPGRSVRIGHLVHELRLQQTAAALSRQRATAPR